jgi:HlyD family secretion protein
MQSAPSILATDPEPSPQQPEIHPEPAGGDRDRRKSRARGLASIAAAVILLAIVAYLALGRKTPAAGNSAATLSNNPGQVLRLKGTTEAVQSRAILAPLLSGQQVGSLTIIHLTPAGTKVKKGDPLVEFDRQAQMRDVVDKRAEYEKLLAQVAEEQAKESAARAKDDSELKQAEDSLRKAELEMQKAEIVSRIDAEKNQENLDEAKATYQQLQQTYDLKRKAALAAIRILEIQRDRTRQTMEHAQSNSDLMQIHSPIDGVVVLNTIWKQGPVEVQEGDQVRPGVPFMQVVNPAAMQVRVMANQQDFPILQTGQTAKVRLDAYPELVFAGRLDQLSPIGENGDFSNKVRSFAVIVSIQGNDPKLMPDLSAAVDVDLSGKSGSTKAAAAGAEPGTRSGS